VHCASDMCISLFRIFISFTVCIFRGVEIITAQVVGAPECRGPLCTAQPIATPLLLHND